MNIKLFKDSDFRLLMLGKLVSLIGTQMQNFALSLYVFKITGSATVFASVLAVAIIPQILLGPICGVFSDWLDRKKIIVYLDMIRGIVIGIYAFIFYQNGDLPLASIYALVIILSLTSLLFQPAVQTVIPSIVKKDELVDANAINSLIMNMGILVAPILGGLLFGIYGLLVILIFNAISFVMSSISEMFINIPKTNKKPEKINIRVFLNDFTDGIKFIKRKKIILNIITLGIAVNFVGASFGTIGLVYISKKILMVTDFQYGILEGSMGLAMILAPIISGVVAKKVKLGKIMFWDIFLVSILFGVVAIVPAPIFLNLFKINFIPYIILMILTFLISLISSVGNIALSVMFQQVVPLSIMGRVSTVMTTGLMATSPLGQMIFGILYDKIDAWMCMGITAIIPFVTILLLKKSFCNDEEIEENNY